METPASGSKDTPQKVDRENASPKAAPPKYPRLRFEIIGAFKNPDQEIRSRSNEAPFARVRTALSLLASTATSRSHTSTEPIVLFVGLNPGIQTASSGHAYAHPTNLFWPLLYSSGITSRRCWPSEDRKMPAEFGLGFTNIVERPSRNGAELADRELDAGVKVLEREAREFRPQTMCIVGKTIWESIWRVRHSKPVGKNFKYGWQDESENMGRQGGLAGNWKGARVFVVTTTSALAVSMSMAEKEMIWAELGTWV